MERAAFLLHDVFDVPFAEVGRDEGSVDERTFKLARRFLGFQALQLLRAFLKIDDPERQREVILHAEKLASPNADAFPPPSGADR